MKDKIIKILGVLIFAFAMWLDDVRKRKEPNSDEK
jgi:hypothetical protein